MQRLRWKLELDGRRYALTMEFGRLGTAEAFWLNNRAIPLQDSKAGTPFMIGRHSCLVRLMGVTSHNYLLMVDGRLIEPALEDQEEDLLLRPSTELHETGTKLLRPVADAPHQKSEELLRPADPAPGEPD
jgi:hypothetical protein